MFLRDFEHLPERSPFDVDLLAPPAAADLLLAHLEDEVRRHGLIFASRPASNGALALILDPGAGNRDRAWAYLEVHNRVLVPGLDAVTAEEVPADRSTGRPAPAVPWRLFFGIVQGVRKRNRDFSSLAPLARAGGGTLALAAERLAITAAELQALLEGGGASVYQRLCIRIAPMLEKPPARRGGTRDWLLRRFYVLHPRAPLLFTLCGADGVGKTTVTGLLDEVMADLPIPYTRFHHITGWKQKRRGRAAAGDGMPAALAAESPVSPPHRLLRFVYRRVLNDRWRALWVNLSGYHLYCRRLHARIHLELRQGRLLLLDRYIYDQLTRLLVRGAPWRLLHRTYGRLLMPPRLAIVLVDDPERVHQRKQELSVDEIARYQDTLLAYVRRHRIPHRVVEVAGRAPAEVAQEVASLILGASGRALFGLVRAWRQERDTAQ